ncbi:MAG: hypothetical protein LC655_02340, partial [Bacteroidales bacterium]|nr:hypothetical protein [Bacteroidales bacterium]
AKINEEYRESGRVEQQEEALELLKNELLREQDSLTERPFDAGMFAPEEFDDALSSKISVFLSDLNNFYLKQYMVNNRIKQGRLNQIMKDRKELYYEMLDKYHNESVADQVKKIYEKNKIVESDGRLYQQSDPIFLLPEQTRSHFYAPVKKLFGNYFDTYWFNIVVLWLGSLILYVVLYYDLLRRLVRTPFFIKSR